MKEPPKAKTEIRKNIDAWIEDSILKMRLLKRQHEAPANVKIMELEQLKWDRAWDGGHDESAWSCGVSIGLAATPVFDENVTAAT